MNVVKYRDKILEPIVRPFLESPNGEGMSFQDDNARHHRARVIDDYKNAHNIKSIPRPSLSPDLNPIEHLWDELGRRIYRREHPVQNLRQLEQAILQAWDQIPAVRRKRLVASRFKRCAEVIQNNGGHTHY